MNAGRSRRRWRWALALAAIAVAGVWAAIAWLRSGENSRLPNAPPGIVVGVPERTLRFAAYNIYHNYRGMDGTLATLRTLDPAPDFILLSEIEPQHVRPMAAALSMPYSYYPSLGLHGGEPAWPDVAILSRRALYDGRPLRTGDGHCFGLWAYAVVDGKKFAVAGVHLWPTFMVDPRHVIETAQRRRVQLEVIDALWRLEGTPPLVLGGDFNQPAAGHNYELMTRDFTDTLSSLGKAGNTFGRKLLQVRIDYLLATAHWQPRAGGVIGTPPTTGRSGPTSGPRPWGLGRHPDRRRAASSGNAYFSGAGSRRRSFFRVSPFASRGAAAASRPPREALALADSSALGAGSMSLSHSVFPSSRAR